MKLAMILAGVAIVGTAIVACPVTFAQSAEDETPAAEAAVSTGATAAATEPAETAPDAGADTGTGEQAAPGVDCSHHVNCDDVTDAKLHRRSGKSYWGIGKKKQPPDWEVLEKCETQFELAYCGLSDDWEVNMFLGMVKAEFEKYECVGKYFDQALALTDDKGDREKISGNRGHYWVEEYNEALNMFNEGAFPLAEEFARRAILIDATDCRGFAMLGSCYANQKKYAEAIVELEKGLDLCPDKETIVENLFAAYYNRAIEIFNEAGDADGYRQAIEYFAKADDMRDDDPNNLYYYQIALVRLVQHGDSTAVDAARDVIGRFDKIAETQDDRLHVKYNLATLESEIGNLDVALAAAKECVQLKPSDPYGYSLVTGILIRLDRAGDAEPYIIMTYCMRAEELTDTGTWCTGVADTFGAASDLAKIVGSNGCPDRVWIHIDSSGTQMVAIVYTGPQKAYAYYDGEKKGEFDFPTIAAP